jgi:hypothetical protein
LRHLRPPALQGAARRGGRCVGPVAAAGCPASFSRAVRRWWWRRWWYLGLDKGWTKDNTRETCSSWGSKGGEAGLLCLVVLGKVRGEGRGKGWSREGAT